MSMYVKLEQVGWIDMPHQLNLYPRGFQESISNNKIEPLVKKRAI